MAKLATHDDGMCDIGADGVVRSFHPNGTLLDYARLSPHHLQSLIKQHQWSSNLKDIWSGVNGYDVTDEQAKAGKLPIPVAEEKPGEAKAGAVKAERSDTDGE